MDIFTLPNLLKYLTQGLVVAVASNVIPSQKLNVREIAMISTTSALTFMLLDAFVPDIARGARFATGMAIGTTLA